jgi:hypothetical protein
MGAARRTLRAVAHSRARAVVRGAALAALAFFATGTALGQTHKPIAPVRPHAPIRAAAPKAPAPADAGPAPPAPTPASPAAASAVASDAGVVEAKTLDGGTQVFRFKELDIEGRLKSPQLVYFLRRVRAEFAAGDLGHRSFLREMSETRKESSF